MLNKLSSPMLIAGISGVITMLFLLLANWIEFMVYPAMVSGGVCVIAVLVMIVFAWIINPIKEFREKKK